MILGAIGRLTDQKGFDLLLEAAPELIRRGVRIAMLGSGEPALEGAMRLLEAHAPGRFRAFVGYDEPTAHRIEAGADAFVMPSRFEPCGLNQMYSLAYGTPPIVRKTGGLADSVDGFDGQQPRRGDRLHVRRGLAARARVGGSLGPGAVLPPRDLEPHRPERHDAGTSRGSARPRSTRPSTGARANSAACPGRR